jgi:hypothetical protein
LPRRWESQGLLTQKEWLTQKGRLQRDRLQRGWVGLVRRPLLGPAGSGFWAWVYLICPCVPPER